MICSGEKIVGASGAITDYSLWKFKMVWYLYGSDCIESSHKYHSPFWGHLVIHHSSREAQNSRGESVGLSLEVLGSTIEQQGASSRTFIRSIHNKTTLMSSDDLMALPGRDWDNPEGEVTTGMVSEERVTALGYKITRTTPAGVAVPNNVWVFEATQCYVGTRLSSRMVRW